MTALRRLLPVVAGLWLALAPTPAHAECSTPELPVVGCVAPGPTASPTATPAPTEPPTSAPTSVAVARTTTQSPILAPPVATQPVPQVPAVLAPLPAIGTTVVPPPNPSVAAAPAPVLQAVAAARPAASAAQPSVAVAPLSGVVASSFALVAFGLLAIPLLLSFLAGLRPASLPLASPVAPPSGGTVNTHRTRLWTGLGVLAAAAVVGGVGWYRLSGEPLLNRQIPFMASAGILVVLLSVLGGSLIIAEQLRGDQNRIGELEDAVRALTEALSPVLEQPARRAEQVVVSEPKGRARSRRVDASST